MQFDGIKPQALRGKRGIGERANCVRDILFAHRLAELLLGSRQTRRAVAGYRRRPILGTRADGPDVP
jgi:hypothetical protein